MMDTSTPLYTPKALPQTSAAGFRGRPVEDVVYQVVTVGAILLVLGSVWVF